MQFIELTSKRHGHPEQSNFDLVTLTVLVAGTLTIYQVQFLQDNGTAYEQPYTVHTVGLFSTIESAEQAFDAKCKMHGCTTLI